MKSIYVDNAAGTSTDSRVEREMIRGMRLIGNPSAFNSPGREAFTELEKARISVARFLGAHSEEIIFTASGSEANTLALVGGVEGSGRISGEIITTTVEHKSVLESVSMLAKRGYEARILPVNSEGYVAPEHIQHAVNSTTILVSIMYANNEIGTIHPVVQIGKLIKEFRKKHNSIFPLFHVDACQAPLYLPMDANRLGADLITFNGAKIHGPRGIGVLYVRKGVKITPQVFGGGQEHGVRAGTENLPAILGLAKAVSLIKSSQAASVQKLRDLCIVGIEKIFPDVKLNGPRGDKRLANNINISLPGLHSEQLLLELDKQGIAAGSGSACTARSVEPSHVLKAIGNEPRYLDGALRFSLSRETKKSDIEYLIKTLPKIVQKLRKRYQK